MRSSLARLGAATFVLALGFFAALHTFSSAHAVDYTVTTTADSGPGSLRQALADANASPGHDTITFAVTGTIALDSPLPTIGDDVTLQGPGAGELAISGGYLYRILDISPTVAVTVTDLALIEGRAPNGEAGGAIRSRGQLQLLRVRPVRQPQHVQGRRRGGRPGQGVDRELNRAEQHVGGGGAMFLYRSAAAITGTLFAHNQGSAIGSDQWSAAYITASQILSNTGSGIDAKSTDLALSGVQVLGNADGGVALRGGDLVISGSEIAGNRADEGAGINVVWASALITDTVLARNEARRNGGAVYISIIDEHFTLKGGTLTGNSAPSGAGIYVASGNVQVTASRMLANEGEHGAAIYFYSMRDAVVADSCIVNNRTTEGGATAVEFATYNSYYLSAPKNWWGAVDGPGGAGQGSGDSIGERVVFANFLTSPPEGCPSLPEEHLYLPVLRR